MAGGFVHITAVVEALDQIGHVAGLTPQEKVTLPQLMSFLEVGAISPDYPYLGRQGEWADHMHYERTGEMIRQAIRLLRDMVDGPDRDRCLAWAFGYAAHVATDLTIHPVVEGRVGKYKGNETPHRDCEMHQDVHIWRKRNLGEIGSADPFDINIGECSTDDEELYPAVTTMWDSMLRATYPEAYAADAPDIGQWNRGFRRIVDRIDEVGRMLPFTRHLLGGKGVVYPDQINETYIVELKTPNGPMDYDSVFARALTSIVTLWSILGRALRAQTLSESELILGEIPDADLDTGRMLADRDRYAFW